MKNIFQVMSEKIVKYYIDYCKKSGIRPFKSEVEKKLALLSPGKGITNLVIDYYASKVRIIICFSICALLLLVLLGVSNTLNNEIVEGRILRNTYTGGSKLLNLEAKSESYDYGTIEYVIKNRMYTEAEFEDMCNEIFSLLPDLIKGNNESLDKVVTNLNLSDTVPGYPQFGLSWESGDYMHIHDDGFITDEPIDEQGLHVDFKVTVKYEEMVRSENISVMLYPREITFDEEMQNGLIEALRKADGLSGSDEYFVLPPVVNGEEIIYKESAEPYAIVILIGSILIAILLWIGADSDIDKQYRERNAALLLEYSEFVGKLQLLISSGMTIRGAMERMASDYRKQREEGRKIKYVYEELLICVKKMQDGMNESTAYELFGRRCNLMNYKKVVSLLTQNLKKGTYGLSQALTNEIKSAFEERKSYARRMGEEAQTKLLFPMILMLGVVMIIIMIPAYMSFGGM